ncbi:Hca operon transcriptional activator [Aquisphaera giovannonii]|uniref:Hca operon transcriptional activator n=1 Tax=Aquisphaera giovannonii TaxID=406548 RepID=A0A5B9VXE7_9BACT|nr:Hca operon transcriptional activator [Aquisphaera giovannonii]
MELRHIRYFLAVAEEGNFTRAAARLGIGQPPLSQQIKDLEREVGVRLFHRVPRGAELTAAGLSFLASVRDLPGRAEDAIRTARRADRGEIGNLTLGVTGSVALNPRIPAIIRAFRRAYPHVELRMQEANSVELYDALRDLRLDVAILRPHAASPEGLEVTRLEDEALIAALPADHPAVRGRGAIDLAALRDEPFILAPRDAGTSLRTAVFAACQAAGFDPRPGPSAPHIASILSLVGAELGVSLVPAALKQLSVQGVAFRPLAGGSATIGLAIARRRGDTAATTLNFVRQALDPGDLR